MQDQRKLPDAPGRRKSGASVQSDDAIPQRGYVREHDTMQTVASEKNQTNKHGCNSLKRDVTMNQIIFLQ